MPKILFWLVIFFSSHLFGQVAALPFPEVVSQTDSTVTIIPGKLYKGGKIKSLFAGEHYRKVWTSELTIRKLFLDRELGGLKPEKTGGNMQSFVLQLKDSTGNVFVLRSVQKTMSRLLPKDVRGTFFDNIAQDQVAGLYPFSAILSSRLSTVVNINNSQPELVFLPDQPSLGEFRETFANHFFTLEIKPKNEKIHHYKNEGFFYAVDTDELYDSLETSAKHKVDAKEFARCRMFDMLIGDWDRSEDQWKWLVKKDGENFTYVPFARDRDQAFVRMDGFIPRIYRTRYLDRKVEHFDLRFHDLSGLNLNARWIDRKLLTELTHSDWVSAATDVIEALNDSVIERIVQNLPGENRRHLEDLELNLKTRRNFLREIASRYYAILSEDVDLVGTHQNDKIKIIRNADESCDILFTSDADTILKRKFFTRETDEIRVYLLEGKDSVHITGRAFNCPRIRIIGGEGKDFVLDTSVIEGPRHKTKIYDIPQGMMTHSGGEVKSILLYDTRVNEYDRYTFEYDLTGPLIVFEFNANDGLFLGGGIFVKDHGFRKKPFANLQKFYATSALKSKAFEIRYKGEFLSALRKWDLLAESAISSWLTNNYPENYLVTNSEVVGESKHYHLDRILTSVKGQRRIENRHIIRGGFFIEALRLDLPHHLKTNVNQPKARIHTGLTLDYSYQTFTDTLFPMKGFFLKGGTRWSYASVTTKTNNIISAETGFYLSLFKKIVYAARAGASHIAGSYQFYELPTLSGVRDREREANARGLERNHFAGESVLYFNNELRVPLVKLRFIKQTGALLFFDTGRFFAGKTSSGNFFSQGAGFWITPLNRTILTFTGARSDQGNFFTISTGLFF